jgi:tetratricopeptide (TPR) repeat protein
MKKTWFIALIVIVVITGVSYAQESGLGKIDFPNSGSAEAQLAFLNGMGMVHSFEWEDAIESFQEAQKIDPDFVLAYWGEALSHYEGHHFEPNSTDVPAGRAALQKLGRTKKERLDKAPNDRERCYLEAVELLYGAGSPEERTQAYSDRMAALWKAYPEDHEAASLYALSLMRAKVWGPESLRSDMQAGAIAQMVLRANPDHPGAAHYVIHAYDDPIHAPIALYAAYKYSDIAPSAVHALHMPAHIFVQHGMWDRVVERNVESYAASVERAKRKGLSPTRHSWHALYWLQYAYLQQGQYDKAQECVDELKAIASREDATRYIANTVMRMESLQIAESEKWKVQDIDTVLAQIDGDGDIDERAAAAVLLSNGLSAAHAGDIEAATKSRDGLKRLTAKMEDGARGREQVEISWLETAAVLAEAEARHTDALNLMAEAVRITETLVPPQGPPGESDTDTPVKPPHELYGEMLLANGKPAEALVQYEVSLLRTPNRARSLLGGARAAVKVGNTELATELYGGLVNLGGAGPELPGRAEAEQFLSTASSEDR